MKYFLFLALFIGVIQAAESEHLISSQRLNIPNIGLGTAGLREKTFDIVYQALKAGVKVIPSNKLFSRLSG